MQDADLQIATEGDAHCVRLGLPDACPDTPASSAATTSRCRSCSPAWSSRSISARVIAASRRCCATAPHWCRDIGMRKVPDHNTLCRAFHALNLNRRIGKLMDRLTQWFAIARQLGSIVAIDSSLYDTHHRSRHYEQRCRHYASQQKRTANARRSRSARRSPKLSIGVCTRSHLILSARARTGMGSDAPTLIRCCSMPGDASARCALCWPMPDTIRRPIIASRGRT